MAKEDVPGSVVSFADVEVREFEPLPKARYLASVSACDYVEESARSGEPGVAWEFTVKGGEFDGRKAFLNQSLQKQSRWSVMRTLMALGYTEEELKAKDCDFEDPAVIEDILTRDCVIVIRHEKYEGESRQRVTRVISADNLGGVVNAEAGEVPF